jgi:hypothetical protein
MIMAEELVVGTMVPLPEGSTRPMASTVVHSGIVSVSARPAFLR